MGKQSQRIIIMAGGTGGHIFPALAVAQYLIDKNWHVSWIGTQQGMESHLIPAHNIEIDWLSVAGIRGKGLLSKINNVWALAKSCWQVFKVFRTRKPNVVLGMGGYVAGPGGLIASIIGIPLVIHEQNRVPGTTNKLLMHRAKKVLEAFPKSFNKDINALFTGNPLRTNFLMLPEKQLWTQTSQRAFRILIVGGSQGAKILNEIVPETLLNLEHIDVKHQTGKASFESVSEIYKKSSCQVKVMPFIDDMAAAYQWADMIICRSGAMTVSEVAAAGLPAIFVPLPHAIDDHQTANARYLTDGGASILLAQRDFNKSSLSTAIKQVKDSLQKMSMATKNKAKLNAAEMVANVCIKEAA